MANIHDTAVVDSTAVLGLNVVIGPFCVVEAGVVIGDDCTIEAGAVIKSGTTLGCNNQVGEGAVLGGNAQHVRRYEPGGTLIIGNHNRIREKVTIHRGLTSDAATIIGDENFFMVASHIAHDCRIGNHCVLVNHVLLGGLVQVDDGAYVGGAAAVAPHCRIGRLAMIACLAKVTSDVPPYMTVEGSQVVGLNKVGLRRSSYSPAQMVELKEAYRVVYRQGLTRDEVLETLRSEFASGPASEINEFLSRANCGFAQERRKPRRVTRCVDAAPQVDCIQTNAREPVMA